MFTYDQESYFRSYDCSHYDSNRVLTATVTLHQILVLTVIAIVTVTLTLTLVLLLILIHSHLFKWTMCSYKLLYDDMK